MNTTVFLSRHPQATTALGFTIIELMIVVVILVVLLSLGVPGMTQLIVKTRVKNASFDVYSSILAARSDAISRNKTITITPKSVGNWAAGWTITDSDGNIVKEQDALSGISASGPTLSYNSTGRLPDGTALANRRISLTAPDASVSDGRCITIDLSGRPVVATGVCS